jgi:hypothetical protein
MAMQIHKILSVLGRDSCPGAVIFRYYPLNYGRYWSVVRVLFPFLRMLLTSLASEHAAQAYILQ